jgi:hypothetical protein
MGPSERRGASGAPLVGAGAVALQIGSVAACLVSGCARRPTSISADRAAPHRNGGFAVEALAGPVPLTLKSL